MREQLRLFCCVALGLSVAALASPAGAGQTTASDGKLIKTLSLAAPKNVLDHATIMSMEADGKMRVVREGDNGFTCMDPGGSPMCADKAAMEWVDAWQAHESAPRKLGFIYMLNGDNGASNTDPYATRKTADNNWIKTGAHVMIVGSDAKVMLENYPRDAKPDPRKPYVMWAGTPYEHLMLPVK